MIELPYSQLDTNHLTLRDHLALDRTTLANERTFLAYVRTALALFIIGVTFLHFLEQGVFQGSAYVFIAMGGIAFVVGIAQFFRVRKRLARVRLISVRQEG